MKNKKAAVLNYFMMISVVMALGIFYVLSIYKNMPANTEFVGQTLLDSHNEIQHALNSIYFIQEAGNFASYNAIYLFSRNGTYFNNKCGTYIEDSKEYILWETSTNGMECYPTEESIKTNFAKYLNQELNKYFEPMLIPTDNYYFNIKEVTTTIIDAVAMKKITSTSGLVEYSFDPSFQTELPIKLITKFKQYSDSAQEIKDDIKECLRTGSKIIGDNDLETCSNLNSIKIVVRSISSYDIKIDAKEESTSSGKNYTFLVDIKDDTKDLRPKEELMLSFGINFEDVFPPTITEIDNVLTRHFLSKYLTWSNYASDAKKYEIYAREVTKLLRTGEDIPPPTTPKTGDKIITIEDKTEWKIDYSVLKNGKDYYFYIIAEDDIGNKATDIKPTRITI